MKKTSSFFAVFFAVLAAASTLSGTARADRYHPPHGGDNGAGLSAFLVTLDLYSLSTTAAQDDRAVYVQQVHEDAAEYLADGTQTALLDEAVQNTEEALQSQGQGQTASETQIATALLSYN